MRISLLIPTRKRPDNMQRVVDSAFKKANKPSEIEVIFYIDNDDNESTKKIGKLGNWPQVGYVPGERIVLSQMWNECWKVATADIGMHCGDDVVFITQGWDNIIYQAFQEVSDKIMFAYGRDGIVDSDELGTHGFIHRNWVETVGYFVPPYFSWCYNDTWLTDVSKKIGRLKYIPELLIEHLHPAHQSKKIAMDSTYLEASARGRRDKCLDIYNSKEHERVADAAKLTKFIENFNG